MTGEWTSEGPNILDAAQLEKFRRVLEDEAPVILEHWFYRGSRAPARLVFDDYEDFFNYVKSEALPGDSFHLWHFAEVCRNDNRLGGGKFPNADGLTPLGGAY
jgi:hypothetical protein